MYQENKTSGRVDGEWLTPMNDQPPQDNKETKPKFYKPFILWTSTLSVLLGITIILIAITELACQKLPNAENRGFVGSIDNRTGIFKDILPGKLGERQLADPTPSDNAVSTSTQLNTVGDVVYTIEFEYEFGPESTTEAPPPTPTPYEYTTTFETYTVDDQGITSMVTMETVVSTSTILFQPGTTTGGPPSKAWNKIGTRTIGTKFPTAPANAPSPEVTRAPGEIPAKNTDVPGIDNKASSVVQPVMPTITPATFVAVATTITDTLGKAKVTTVPVALDSAGSTIKIASGLISADATTTFIRAPTASSSSGSKPGAQNGTSSADDGSTYVLSIFTMRDYVTGAFLPTILAVLFAIPWALVNAAAKEMEPIYQLAELGGASAANSLVLNYVTMSMFVAPFRAFSRRHWMIVLTSVLALLSLLTPPLAVESVFISLSGVCGADADSEGCIPTLSVFKKAARVLESVLAFMAILLGILIYIAHKRSSNVAAEPLSLAGVATLMQNQEFLNIIRELPSHGVKEKALLALLPPHSFKIGHFQNADGTWGYGLMLSREISSPNTPYVTSNTYANTNLNHQIDHDSIEEKAATKLNRFSRIFQVIGFAFMLLGILILVGFYRFVDSDYKSGFGRFMNNQQFGVKFLFTSLGVVIAQFWAYARETIHRNEPYHNLTKGASTPENSILISPSLAPITSIFTSLRRLAPLLILLDASTLLADFLIITLANIPYSSANTLEAWTICCYMSIVILAFMLITLLVVLIRIGRFGGSGQDVPNTLVGKCVLMCGSSMLERFVGLGEESGQKRNWVIKSWGTRFGAGRVRGVDGVVRRGVDFEDCVEGGSRGRN